MRTLKTTALPVALLTAATMLVACSEQADEPSASPAAREIVFAAAPAVTSTSISADNSRATIVTESLNAFHLYAFNEDNTPFIGSPGNAANGVLFSYTNNTDNQYRIYSDGNSYLWSKDTKLSFYAFVNLGNNRTYTNADQTNLSEYQRDPTGKIFNNIGDYYTNGKDGVSHGSGAHLYVKWIAPHDELLYAAALNKSMPDDGKVKLNFCHALSSLDVRMTNKTQSYTFTVNSITANYLHDNGTLVFPAADTNNEHPGFWDNVWGSFSCTVIDDTNIAVNVGATANLTSTAAGTNFFIIPSTYYKNTNQTGDSNYPYLEMKITVSDNSGRIVRNAFGIDAINTTSDQSTLRVPLMRNDSFTFEIGKHYQLTYTINSLMEITLSATVADWTSEGWSVNV